MNRKTLVGVGAGILLVGGWAAFRPELLFVNTKVSEAFPTAIAADAPRILAAGDFHTNAHETNGRASIHSVNGKEVLRLTNFHTSNGPDVHVLLVAASDVKEDGTVKKSETIDLGSLKGNQGDQNYDVPAGTDLGKFRSVTIWCKRFGVNFGTAPLAQVAGATEPRRLAAGSFKTGAHETQGSAGIYEVEGKRVLRLTGFHTSNGPDVHVLLVGTDQVKSDESVRKAGFIDLGSLKGTQGDQNYDLPADADLTRYRSVSIWCKRFGVNFGAASLNRDQG